jgi:hypothetical protein
MPSNDNYTNAYGFEHIVNAIGNLGRHFFLHLKTPRVSVHNPRQFTDTYNFMIGEISNIGFACNQGNMMLAMGFKSDAP